MNKVIGTGLLVAMALSLVAFGPTALAAPGAGVTYMKSEQVRNAALETAIIAVMGLREGEADKTRYYYNFVDLNDDGTPEVFVQLLGATTSGSGGDTGLLFRQLDSGFDFLQQFTLIRNPLIISDTKTNGWHDIVFRQSGGGAKARYICMKFDGKQYPHPNQAPALDMPLTDLKGFGIINDDIGQDFRDGRGLYLK